MSQEVPIPEKLLLTIKEAAIYSRSCSLMR